LVSDLSSSFESAFVGGLSSGALVGYSAALGLALAGGYYCADGGLDLPGGYY